MAKMDMCTCLIKVGNDIRTVVYRGETRPVSHPELELLRFTHGDTAVSEVKILKSVNTTMADEKSRLLERYGAATLGEVYPGARPSLPMTAPKGTPKVSGTAAPKKAAEPTETVSDIFEADVEGEKAAS